MKQLVLIGSILSPVVSYKLHTHEQWEFIYYTSGEGQIRIDNQSYPFREGTLFAVPPNTLHSDNAIQGYTNIYMYVNDLDYTASPFYIQDTASRDLYSLLVMLQKEYLLKQKHHESIISALLGTILTYVDVLYVAQRGNSYVDVMKQSIIEHISDSGFLISDLYSSLTINSDYARRLFVKEVGVAPINYLNQLRINKAKELLQISNDKFFMYEIALQCGFSDPYHFSKVFKQHTGLSPSAWRKKHI